MDYRKLYLLLFNAITDALAELEKGNCQLAEQQLKQAQIDAERLYVEYEEV